MFGPFSDYYTSSTYSSETLKGGKLYRLESLEYQLEPIKTIYILTTTIFNINLLTTIKKALYTKTPSRLPTLHKNVYMYIQK